MGATHEAATVAVQTRVHTLHARRRSWLWGGTWRGHMARWHVARARALATCRLSGYLPLKWLPAERVATCRASGNLPSTWLPAAQVATCQARGYLPRKWLPAAWSCQCPVV